MASPPQPHKKTITLKMSTLCVKEIIKKIIINGKRSKLITAYPHFEDNYS
jgi:hypothetical protein